MGVLIRAKATSQILTLAHRCRVCNERLYVAEPKKCIADANSCWDLAVCLPVDCSAVSATRFTDDLVACRFLFTYERTIRRGERFC
jgi:hypothetical protein